MRFKIASYCLTLVLSSALITQEAGAQEEGGRSARFKFAPNIWRSESARMPRDHYAPPAHNVRPGAVPMGSSMLGVDPQLLAKPPATVAQPQVHQNVTPQISVPLTTGAFSPAFGKPATPAQPMAAAPASPLRAAPASPIAAVPAAPVPAQPAPPAPAPQKAVPQAVAAKPQPQKPAPAASNSQRQATTAVSGRVASRPASKAPVGLAANPGGVASYGKVGYQPGPWLPAQSTASSRTETTVSGRLIPHN